MNNELTAIENERALDLSQSRQKESEIKEQETLEVSAATNKEINGIETGVMLAFAAASDVLDYLIVGSIPLVGDIIDIAVWLIITAWVIMRGLEKPKWLLASGGAELVPLIGDIIPTYILMVLIIIIYNNKRLR